MYKSFLKRLFDFILALILLIILVIPFCIISFFIKIDSKGDIFYRQDRIGRGGKIFKIFKFRTMVPNADKIGGYSTAKNDNRVTKIGAYLRKTSLDELPQILNVLMGDMSFIGPRPDVPAQKVNYTQSEWKQRHQVLPGITGIAQCRNRHNVSNSARKRYDIFYNRKVGFILDIKILLWTMKVLKQGSY